MKILDKYLRPLKVIKELRKRKLQNTELYKRKIKRLETVAAKQKHEYYNTTIALEEKYQTVKTMCEFLQKEKEGLLLLKGEYFKLLTITKINDDTTNRTSARCTKPES